MSKKGIKEHMYKSDGAGGCINCDEEYQDKEDLDRANAMQKEIESIRAERDLLKDALQFYANRDSYLYVDDGSEVQGSAVHFDKGRIAREALNPTPPKAKG